MKAAFEQTDTGLTSGHYAARLWSTDYTPGENDIN
jgi:hypothetical protein